MYQLDRLSSDSCPVGPRVNSVQKTTGSPWTRREVTLLVLGMVLGQFLYHNLLVVLVRGHQVVCPVPRQTKTSVTEEKFRISDPVDMKTEDLLFVGVMTSRRYLETRARAIYDTWGGMINGSIVFFVGEGDAIDTDLPVEILHGVTDSEYPPQRKSFTMLDHMYRKVGDHYSWFMRVDDDLFVDVHRLQTLLLSLNDSLSWYLGHPGTGRPEEEGRLGLPPGSAYCMGGTGVLLSRDVLEALSGKLAECLERTVSDHEDSELGRCIYNTSGLTCSNIPRVYRLFKQNYDDTSGAWLQRALRSPRHYVTFHPVKDTRYMYLGTALLLSRDVFRLQVKLRQLSAAVECIDIRFNGSSCQHKASAGGMVDPCLPGTGSAVSIADCDFSSTRRTRSETSQFLDTPWSLITRNVLYTLSAGTLRKPADYAGISVGLHNAMAHVARHLKQEQETTGQTRITWSDNHYRRHIPLAGVRHVTFVRVGSYRLRPYVIRQEFDELVMA